MTQNTNEKRPFSILKKDQSLEKVSLNKYQVSQLTSHDGTEVIHHRLSPGANWAMIPQDGWEALESIYVLSGNLIMQTDNEETSLTQGDFVSAHPVKDHMVFIAENEVEFLYISSQPVFHHYSKATKDLMDLAVSIEEKDGYTSDHCQRIRELSILVGKKMGLSYKRIVTLNYGAFFHDIGKIKVPEAILFKPNKLTDDEWEIMKLHTITGAQLLRKTKIPHLVSAADIVEQHHERFNGNGYPFGLTEDEISIEASIVAVVDSFDAMTSNRVYQSARSKEEAIAEIKRCRGTHYHPDVVDVFLSIVTNLHK